MLIDFESIVIIDGEASEKIISGAVKTEVVQRSAADGFTENSFVRNSAVIQCISPSVNDDGKKVKFSVVYRPAASLNFELAAVLLSSACEFTAEVRSQNETTAREEGVFSGFSVKLSETEGKLELDFITPSENRADDILDAIREISTENEGAESEIRLLEQQLLEESSKSENLSERKYEITEKINALRTETEKMDSDMNELNQLEQKKEVLRKNLEENEFNSERLQSMKYQLEQYSGILEYYKTEEGYITVSEKLGQIISEIRTVEEGISELAGKRREELE